MTDLEKIELAMHRLAQQLTAGGDAEGIAHARLLRQLADQIAVDEKERREQN